MKTNIEDFELNQNIIYMNFLNSKERILKYIEYKSFSRRSFCKKIGISHSIFDSGKNFGTDKAALIIDKCPDLNPEWFLTGKGSMLRPVEKTLDQNDTEQEKASMAEEENDKLLLTESKDWPEATQRLRALINHFTKGSVTAFANNLEGVSQVRLNRVFNVDGRTKRYPGIPDIIFSEIARNFPSVNMEWLLIGRGEMLKENDIKKDIVVSKGCSSCQEKDKVIESKDKQIDDIKTSLERQIASLQSNMEIIIKAKDELLKAREEMLKQKDELIATQKQQIEELSRKNNLDDLPAAENITFEQQGEMTEVKHTKKRWDNTAKPEMTRPPRSK